MDEASDWWKNAVVYQIYPRSFADANGDGIGDLAGITSRVDYLASLGVDAIWLSPFYPSPLKDGGYDVANYRDVAPEIGSLEDFDSMLAALSAVGIKVIVDLVPNHTSDQHMWFQEALQSAKDSAARNRYHFRDGKGVDGTEPPNDWTCSFGGSAWEPVGDGQFYLHLFDPGQVDLNWDNLEVRADFLDTLRFWGDRGVAGFRVDVANHLVKDMSEPYMTQAERQRIHEEMMVPGYPPNRHPLRERDGVFELYRDWRKVLNEYSPPLTGIAEAWVAPDRRRLYAAADGLGQAFALDPIVCHYAPTAFKEMIRTLLKDAEETGSPQVWTLQNHDFVRHVTRYGMEGADNVGTMKAMDNLTAGYLRTKGREPPCDLDMGLERAKAATLLLLGLPGSVYLYQGEELGLPEVVDLPDQARQDPIWLRSKGQNVGRDGCRVPIPWKSSGVNLGFGDGQTAHLPLSSWMAEYSVESESASPESTLSFYKKAIEFRRKLASSGHVEWVDQGENVVRYKRRGGWEVVMNFGDEEVPVGGEAVITSSPIREGKLSRDSCAWVRTKV